MERMNTGNQNQCSPHSYVLHGLAKKANDPTIKTASEKTTGLETANKRCPSQIEKIISLMALMTVSGAKVESNIEEVSLKNVLAEAGFHFCYQMKLKLQ